uniref:Uncharacterized protein n=1 Tax=Rhizophora mucronata TaxID=61149 RepID=A0A2P2LN23_RHIMU
MDLPSRHKTALESPQFATMIISGVTTATTAVDPTASQSGDCISHRQSGPTTSLFHPTTSLSIRQKLRSIALFHSIGDSAAASLLSISSFTSSCSLSLHLIAT